MEKKEGDQNLAKIASELIQVLGEPPEQTGENYTNRDEFMTPGDIDLTHTLADPTSFRKIPSSNAELNLFSDKGKDDPNITIQVVRPVYFRVQKDREEKKANNIPHILITGNYVHPERGMTKRSFALSKSGETWTYDSQTTPSKRPAGEILNNETKDIQFWSKILSETQKAPQPGA